ncbi:hypothetical protein LIER_25598 [Lithospermum erythrorhizon]|uniref:Uncharacterized protein n=1 Tax=Lithospermum erythrorhizon TaxID=34254 RepID=A0AAV3R6N9_LITER
MGNYMSCSVLSPSIMKNNKAARVILPGGEVRQFREPIKGAEIMLECPNYFLVNSNGLNIGRRFSALSADEDLELGNLYIMFPMRRVNSLVMTTDMAVVLMGANTAAKRLKGGGNVRISPEGEAAADEEILLGGEYKYRSSVCRSRKPVLDTIFEEPVLSS